MALSLLVVRPLHAIVIGKLPIKKRKAIKELGTKQA
jgi:hypothetical protein